MPFLSIAQTHIPTFNEGRICPDQYVGEIIVTNNILATNINNNNNNDFFTRTDLINFNRSGKPVIFLILESPHKKEFEGVTPKPAAGNYYGDTGSGIRELLKEVLTSCNYIIPNGTYSLIIMNAIQYQCSLGINPKVYRDKIFIKCWNSFGKQDFEQRLNQYYQIDDIIINACTKGPLRPFPYLYELVENSIVNIGLQSHFKIQHPSSWRRIYNTAFKNGITVNYNW